MKTIILAALAVFTLSHNVMADDSAADTMSKETTMTKDNGDGTMTKTHKHMKKGHGKKMMKKSESTMDKMDKDAAPAAEGETK